MLLEIIVSDRYLKFTEGDTMICTIFSLIQFIISIKSPCITAHNNVCWTGCGITQPAVCVWEVVTGVSYISILQNVSERIQLCKGADADFLLRSNLDWLKKNTFTPQELLVTAKSTRVVKNSTKKAATWLCTMSQLGGVITVNSGPRLLSIEKNRSLGDQDVLITACCALQDSVGCTLNISWCFEDLESHILCHHSCFKWLELEVTTAGGLSNSFIQLSIPAYLLQLMSDLNLTVRYL